MAGRKEKKIREKVAKGNAYISYFNLMRKQGKQPMTKYHWGKSGRTSGYGTARGKTTDLAKLTRRERKKIGLKD
jgi:hypothetical protein